MLVRDSIFYYNLTFGQNYHVVYWHLQTDPFIYQSVHHCVGEHVPLSQYYSPDKSTIIFPKHLNIPV